MSHSVGWHVIKVHFLETLRNPLDPVGQTSMNIDPLWMFTFKWEIRILTEVVSYGLIMATAAERSMRGMISSQCHDCIHCMLSVCRNWTAIHTRDWPETDTVHASWPTQNRWWTSESPEEGLWIPKMLYQSIQLPFTVCGYSCSSPRIHL